VGFSDDDVASVVVDDVNDDDGGGGTAVDVDVAVCRRRSSCWRHCSRNRSCLALVLEVGVTCLKLGGLKAKRRKRWNSGSNPGPSGTRKKSPNGSARLRVFSSL